MGGSIERGLRGAGRKAAEWRSTFRRALRELGCRLGLVDVRRRVEPDRLRRGGLLVAALLLGACASAGGRREAAPVPALQASTIPHADTSEWRGVQATRVEDLIAGRFAGVDVIRYAGGESVRIRGLTTLVGNTEPLYVIDGMPALDGPGGGLTGINPRDVVKIEVLKDPGLTAQWGARGANGVILVTTKRAR